MPKTHCRSEGPRFELSRRRPSRAALTFILLAVLLTAGIAAAEPPSHSAHPSEVRAAWRPAVHLYVLGDAGLEEDALQELAAWLEDRHWTVLLVADASGQTYRDADGVERLGVDALEYGTGQGIPRQAGFLAQVQPRSKEPDGAILTIVMAQRALFYTGSEAQDRRGLGESQFRGNLDRWAVEAMRSSGDVVSAVKNTVTNIDGFLDAAIEEEVRAAAEARAQAAAEVQSAARALETLEQKAAGLLAARPGLTGELVRPDLQAIRQQIAAAEASLTENPVEATRAAEAVRQQVLARIRAIDGYPAVGEALKAARARLAAVERRERAAAAQDELSRARRALATARRLYDRGAPGYIERLGAAKGALAEADWQVSAADADARLRR